MEYTTFILEYTNFINGIYYFYLRNILTLLMKYTNFVNGIYLVYAWSIPHLRGIVTFLHFNHGVSTGSQDGV